MTSAELLKVFPLAAFLLAELSTSTLANYNYDSSLQHQGYNYSRPEVAFFETTTSAHIPHLKSTPFEPTTKSTTLQHQGYNYPRPEVPFIEATTSAYISRLQSTPPTNFKPSEITTPTTIKITSSKAQPISTSPVNIESPKLNGYSYPRPSIPFNLPANKVSILSPKLVPTQPSKNALFRSLEEKTNQKQSPKSNGYSYSRPSNIWNFPQIFSKTPSVIINHAPSPKIPISKPLIGYSYPKPSIPFNSPLKTSITIEPKQPNVPPNTSKTTRTTETPISEGYSYPKPKMPLTIPVSSPIKPVGYIYSQPEIPFEFPPKNLPTSVQRTHPTPSAKIIPNKSIGYSYIKPLVAFTAPSSPNDLVSLPTKATHQSSNKEDGYNYIRPDFPFSIPSRLYSATPTTSLQTANGNSPTLSPSLSPKKAFGYSYTPPKVPFITPNKAPLSSNMSPGVPTTSYVPTEVKGYFYPKPEKPFEF